MSTIPRIAIQGGRVIDPAAGADGIHDLYLAEGRVAAWDRPPDGFCADLRIEAAGLVVAPGLIDLSAHLREPGAERKATIRTETRAAAAAGITTLCCPPDTHPVIDNPAVADLIQDRAAAAGHARVLPIGSLTTGLRGAELSELYALKKAGCAGVGDAGHSLANASVWRRALEYAASYDLPVLVRPNDPFLAADGCAHEGAVACRLGLPGVPETAETVVIAMLLCLAETTGVRLYFGPLSSAKSVEMIAAAQRQGLRVNAGVAAHHLHLTDEALEGFDSAYHVLPPLRTAADRSRLRQAVCEGVLQVVCSDHQPHEADAKLEAFPSTEPGISGLETLLPTTLLLVDEGVLDLPTALHRLTAGPAAVLGIERGRIQPGDVADLCILDPAAVWTVTEENWCSNGRNTPWWGASLQGRAVCTLLEGCIVYQALAAA